MSPSLSNSVTLIYHLISVCTVSSIRRVVSWQGFLLVLSRATLCGNNCNYIILSSTRLFFIHPGNSITQVLCSALYSCAASVLFSFPFPCTIYFPRHVIPYRPSRQTRGDFTCVKLQMRFRCSFLSQPLFIEFIERLPHATDSAISDRSWIQENINLVVRLNPLLHVPFVHVDDFERTSD